MSLRFDGLTLVIVFPMTLPSLAMTAVEWALSIILSRDLLLQAKGIVLGLVPIGTTMKSSRHSRAIPAGPSRCVAFSLSGGQ